ncbi:hypothetical protein [Pseudomonas syringae group genomosp. 3]|uniref:hypothetical protein n=1 Tax=Pseudomonas syringae group genomosp. 3 TaxID=251701 RepID=UPI000F0066C7|nr:hypothetical protein [Pseudomonas syringae group genomosp. 3]RMR30501.1 hypothetical protein ALP87_01235 [Pseudomonas syringae pv. coriandricola]
MKTVSYQGKTLSASQLRRLQLEAHVRSLTSSPLREQVNETLVIMEKQKADGVRHEPLNKLIENKKGTLSVADWMGY